MSFTLNGSIVEQSGTDTDLSGLSSVSGVTVTTLDAGSGDFEARTLYDLGNYTLTIKGTLTHDPSKEILLVDADAPGRETILIESTGTYNYGVETTFQGGTHYSRGEGLLIRGYLTGSQRQWDGSKAGLRNQGQFNWKGGVISSGRSLITDSGGDIFIREGIFKPWCTDLTRKDFCPRIGFLQGDVDIDGLEVYGHEGHFFGFALASDTTTNFTNIRIQGTTNFATAIAADLLGSAVATKPHATIDNVSSLANGNLFSARAWQNRVNTWTNYGGGIALKDELSDANSSNASARGIVIAQKQIEPTVVNTAGTALQDVKVLIKEESDGNEATSSFLGTYNATDITHYATARNQILTTNASGVTGQFVTGLVVCHKPDRNTNMIRNVKTIGGGNEQTTRQFGYSYLLNEGRVNLLGTGVLEPTFTMIDDITVDESSKATVDAYTLLDTPEKLYDRAKSYLYDNWAGEGSLLCTRSGNTIDLGNNSLVIDANATQAIAVSGTTITIKANTFVGNLTTGTGTITESNGAFVNGVVTDVNGTRNPPTTITLTGLKPNTEVRVYQAGTATEEGGVENSGTSESFGLTVTSVDVVIHALGYLNQRIEGVDTSSNVTLPISQVVDRQYENP